MKKHPDSTQWIIRRLHHCRKSLSIPTYVVLLFVVLSSMTSCFRKELLTKSIGYQSIRTTFQQSNKTPEDAKIFVAYAFTNEGEIIPVIGNLTSEVMTIDRTKSFFVNTNGTSNAFYDPTVKVSTITNSSSQTAGGSVNLGSVASSIGIGGPLGTLLGGVSVGGSKSAGTSTSITTYTTDQERVSLAPQSTMTLEKSSVLGIGKTYLTGSTYSAETKNTGLKFSVCISYSVDGGVTFDKIVTDFYVNSKIIVPVTKRYGGINEAFRTICKEKPDAMNEKCWILYFDSTIYNSLDHYDGEVYNTYGVLSDYQ